jgi:hypothetical protein
MRSDPMYADYVRIEIRHDGKAEILEITPDGWNRVEANITMGGNGADVGPSLVRLGLATRDRPPDFTLAVSGGRALLAVEDVDES